MIAINIHRIETRPQFEWPNGNRLAFYIGLNVEHFAFLAGMGSDPFNATPRAKLNATSPGGIMAFELAFGAFSKCWTNCSCQRRSS